MLRTCKIVCQKYSKNLTFSSLSIHNFPQSFLISRPMSTESAPSVLIPVANGSEEIEVVSLADTLVRGNVIVTLASVGANDENVLKLSRGIKLQADATINECAEKEYDAIILPGGLPGATHLHDCSILIDMLKRQKENGKYYGAICASPAVVLAKHGLLEAGPITSYPAFADKLPDNVEYKKDERVVVNGKCITSQGPATAMDMGVKIIEILCGKEKATEVAKGLLL